VDCPPPQRHEATAKLPRKNQRRPSLGFYESRGRPHFCGGKSAPPAKSGVRRDRYRRSSDHWCWDAVDSGLAVVKDWRNIAKADRGYDGRWCVAVVGRIVVGRPGAMNELWIRSEGRANGAGRGTPAAAGTRIEADLRTCLSQTQHSGNRQTCADYDFRSHAIAMLLYINAHELASCNTDCCRFRGNLPIVFGLRVGEIYGNLLQIDPGLSGQAARCCDPHPDKTARQALQGHRKDGFRERPRLEFST